MTTPMPSNPDILQIAGNIILNEMGLSNDQIWIWNSKRNIPNDDKLYIVLSETSNELIANNKYYESDLTGLKEIQCQTIQALITVDILSAGEAARLRKNEVIMALNSTYSENIQDRYGCNFSRIPASTANLSVIEGSQIPYRYNITFRALYSKESSKYVDYYNQVQNPEVHTNP